MPPHRPLSEDVIYHGHYVPLEPSNAQADPHQWAELLQDVPGVRELLAEGFVPAETLFGEEDLVRSWPKAHRRVLTDTRYETTGLESFDKRWGARLFLVRSPWPALDLELVVKLLFRWLRRNESSYVTYGEQLSPSSRPSSRKVHDPNAKARVARQFFRQSDEWLRAYDRGRINKIR